MPVTQLDQQSIDAVRARLPPPSPVSLVPVPSAGVVARDGEVGGDTRRRSLRSDGLQQPPVLRWLPPGWVVPSWHQGQPMSWMLPLGWWEFKFWFGAGSPPQGRTISHRPRACPAAHCSPSSLHPCLAPPSQPWGHRPLPKPTRAPATATRPLRSIILHPNHQTPIPSEVRKQPKSFPPSVTQDREPSVTGNTRTTADLFPPHKSR